MPSTGLRICLLLGHVIALTTPAPANLYDGVADGGQSGNPGVKFRVTQKGLDYLNSILLYEMNQIIPRLHIDDMEQSEGNGHVRVTNARVTNWKSPSSQTLKFSPPDQIIWSASGIDLAMTGHISGSMGKFHEEADADVSADDVDFDIAISPVRQGNGQFGAKSRSCKVEIGDMDYKLRNTGVLGKILNNNKNAVIKRFKPKIAQELCKQATKMIDGAANEQLASIPTKVPLNKSADQMFSKSGESGNGQSRSGTKPSNKPKDSDNFFDSPNGGKSKGGDKSREAQRELTKNITKHLWFDYSNLKDPSVQSRYLETYNKGEISYHGQGGTPFMAPSTHENSVQTDRMIYALATDYVANSMLYNAFSHDLLKTRISAEETPDFKAYLKTTCDDDSVFDFCLGSIIPEIQESFPDSQAEVNFEATKAPALFFRKDGTVNLLAQGLLKLVAAKAGQRKTMAVVNLDTVAKANMFINDNRIKGNCTFDKYDVTFKENNLKGFDAKRQKEFTSTSKQMVELMMNAYLKNGMRLPSLKEAKLKNTKLSVFERTARIESDVEADKDQLTRMAAKVIRQHGGRVDGY